MSSILIRLQTQADALCPVCGTRLITNAASTYGAFVCCTPCTQIISDAEYERLREYIECIPTVRAFSVSMGLWLFTPGRAYAASLSPLIWLDLLKARQLARVVSGDRQPVGDVVHDLLPDGTNLDLQ